MQSSALSRPRVLRPPSLPAVVFTVLAVVVPTLLQKPLLNSDGDLARHLRHGRHMLEHGELIRSDPFSFTKPGAPFVGFEYGSQLLYALAERVGGLGAVAVLAGLLIAFTYALLTRFLLRQGVDPLLACLTVALAIALGVGHWTARPHLFSLVAVAILVAMLERPSRRPVPAGAILFLSWVNLHGAFVYGWILIGLYLVGSLAERLWGDDPVLWRSRVRYYLTFFATAVAVSLVNPYGWELHRHLYGFFGTPFLRENTAEFVSPNFHESSGKVFLAVLVLGLTFLTLRRRRLSYPHLLVIGAGIALALLAVRNIPLFGLTVLPMLALNLNEVWQRLPDPRGIRGRFAATARGASTLPWAAPVAVGLLGLALAGGRIGSLQLIRDRFDDTVFPAAAVAQAQSNHLEGRLFTDLTWAGYVIYAWPEQKIFVDGGTDFFGEALFRDYLDIRRMTPGWRKLLEQWDLRLMLLDRQSTLAHELVRDRRWILWYCDSLAVMLARSTDQRSAKTADAAEAELDACARNPSQLVRHADQ